LIGYTRYRPAWQQGLLTLVALVGGLRPVAAMDPAGVFATSEPVWLSRESEGESADLEPLETDRDSFTPSTTLVGFGRALAESSYSFIDNRDTADSHSFPELLIRYGITRNIELRLGWNYEVGGGGAVSGSDAGGEEEPLAGVVEEAQLTYGVKASLTAQRGWIPQSAVILQALTPTAGPDVGTDVTLGYVYGWKLSNDWQLDSSMRYGAALEEGDHFNQWAPSVVLKVPFGERWNVHGEYFGIFTQNRADDRNDQYFSPGIHYLVSPDCEIGIRVGWGLNHDAASFFSNVGLGVRF
jgi:hypothetical protein